MSNINLIIEEKPAHIGNFLVGRLLPFREKRMVGPFIFIDHMGPVKLHERENFDVMPHPHIGLSTLTYLFEGSIMHRDTLGSEVEIKPGAVNWMTAGKWVVHSERTPEYLRGHDKDLHLHGLQIWVALPKHLETMDPAFFHIEADQIPHWQDGALQYKLIAGEVLGRKSPVPVYSPLYMLEIKSTARQSVEIGAELFGESGLYILDGRIEAEGNYFENKALLVAKDSKLCSFTMEANSTVYLFGGDAFPEMRYIDWNFVASEKEIIEAAKDKWMRQDYERIKSDPVDFVPYPTFKLKPKP